MLNFRSSTGFIGSGYIVLNVLRVLSIITLVAIFAANWVMIVLGGLADGFSFFSALSLAFVSFIALFLMVTELPNLGPVQPVLQWAQKTWPVVGPDYGLAWFGLAMAMLGVHTIGGLSNPLYSIDNIGLPMWRLALASGILAIVFGVANVALSFLYSNPESGATARTYRVKGATIQKVDWPQDSYADDNSGNSRTSSVRQEKKKTGIWNLFGGKGKKTSKPTISAPYQHDLERGPDEYPDARESPIAAGIARPPTAMHPIHLGTTPDTPRYSEVSHMRRFDNDDDNKF